jgi:hypothetical protein
MAPLASPAPAVEFKIVEPAQTPLLSLVLGFGAMMPIAVGTIAAWLLPAPFAALACEATILWAGAILTFLSGVRRGVSFRTVGGPTMAQILTVLWLFGLGLLALGALLLLANRTALLLLLAGYASMAVLDPLAARRGEAPLFFARLRPVQMLIPILFLGALLLRILSG